MEPNKPTPRRIFGTDASLSYDEQRAMLERANSKLLTRLYANLDTATDSAELTEIGRGLAQVRGNLKEIGPEQAEQEPTDAQLMKAAKK